MLNTSASTYLKTLSGTITGKANKTLGFVKRNVKTRNEAVKELAYKTLVRPPVEYVSSVWSPHTDKNISKIEMIQRRAARSVKNNYSTYDSVSDMLDNLGWRSFENKRIDARLVMFYKIVHCHVAIQIQSYFEKPQRYTRHMYPLSFRQIHTSATYYQQSFYPATISICICISIAVESNSGIYNRGSVRFQKLVTFMDSCSEAVHCLCTNLTLFQLVPLTNSSDKEGFFNWSV